jgi:hypothetical protein
VQSLRLRSSATNPSVAQTGRIATRSAGRPRAECKLLRILPLFVSVNAEEQRRFDELYQRDAAHNAGDLALYDIEGERIYRYARQIAAGIERSGSVRCADAGPAPPAH